MNEHEIFSAALDVSVKNRAEFVAKACGDSQDLQSRIEELLQYHENKNEFLQKPAGVILATKSNQVEHRLGTQIGPYKLREKIGEGGFGVVYVAEQKKPVARKVALKVIKPGMDSKDIIARFEAERQALAMMDHPNVAKVYDAGTTESGRPYFAMELVHGRSITEFCDEQKLTNRQRLELFVDVCDAVQHAHQKGIIHRDLKPSNVMVTTSGDRLIPKVIDFGVAKALHHELTDKLIYTAYGQLVGTPMYMSPEQAQMSSLDVDTRSDIYSLGVLLYELLTGATPFDKETFKQADFDEMRRIIREDEPRRPSDRVSTLHAHLQSTVSEERNIDQRTLSRSLRGELDWIVLKAMEKDRARRYQTANGLTADVKRYLNDEPVLACPPSSIYRIRKFAKRNQRTLITTSIFALLLIAAVVGISLQSFRATRAEQLAKDDAEEAKRQAHIAKVVQDFWNEDVLGQANPSIQPNRNLTLHQVLHLAASKIDGRFDDQPLVEAAVREAIIKPLIAMGENDKALSFRKRTMDLYESTLGAHHEKSLEARSLLGSTLMQNGRISECKTMLNKALEDSQKHLGVSHLITLKILCTLGVLDRGLGNYEKAFKYFETIRQLADSNDRSQFEYYVAALTNCAVIKMDLIQHKEARPFLDEAFLVASRFLPDEHPTVLNVRMTMADLSRVTKDFDNAIKQYKSLAETTSRVSGETSLIAIEAGYGLGLALWQSGQLQEAEKLLVKYYEVQRKHYPEDAQALSIQSALVDFYLQLNRFEAILAIADEHNHLTENLKFETRFSGYLCDSAYRAMASGQQEVAKPLFKKANVLLDAVIACNPDQQNAKRFLVNSMCGLRDLLIANEEFDEAKLAISKIGRYLEEKSLMPDAHELDNVLWLGSGYCNQAIALGRVNDHNTALTVNKTAIKVLEQEFPGQPGDGDRLSYLINSLSNQTIHLSKLNKHGEAVVIWQKALDLTTDENRERLFELYQAEEWVLAGRRQKGFDLVESIMPAANYKEAIQAATVYAVAAIRLVEDCNLDESRRAASAERFAANAVRIMQTAHDASPFTDDKSEELIQTESFSILMDREDFKQFLQNIHQGVLRSPTSPGTKSMR